MIHPHHVSARTVSVLRFLRAAGPLPRRRRIPRQQQPDLIRAEYYKALLPWIRQAQDAFATVKAEILRLLIDERRVQGKFDIAHKESAKHLIRGAAARTADAFRPTALHDVAARFARRTSEFQREQLDRQVRAAISIPLSTIEKPVRDLIPLFAKQNAELVKTVQDRYFDRLASDVEESFATGMHPDTLAQRFVDVDGMAENDARRLARDQIGKLNAQFNEERQTALGIKAYFWRTARDNRVRDEHAELEGQRFEWDDPPDAGTDGEPANPGEAIQCRCYAEPDFSGILGESE